MLTELRAKPEGDGTRLTQGVEVPLTGAMVLLAPLMVVMLKRSSRKQIAKLKALVEAS